MVLDTLFPPVIKTDAYRDIMTSNIRSDRYSALSVSDEPDWAKQYLPLREFVIPEKSSDKSKRLIHKYRDARFLRKATPMLMENNQIAALYLGEDISATVVFQNDQWVNIAMHKRGEKKAMLTAKAHFSQSGNPAKLLDKLLSLFDDES